MSDRTPGEERARSAAMSFVCDEAGFAQVVTLDRHGFPVGRTMTAFLEEDWTVSLVQRASHARIAQLRREPRALVTWVGTPAGGASNERPHVFDLGLLPPRAVFVRGRVEFMGEQWTEQRYRENIERQRAAGHTAAPLRNREQVAADLIGVRVVPRRIRLEGFGEGAQAFEWNQSIQEQT